VRGEREAANSMVERIERQRLGGRAYTDQVRSIRQTWLEMAECLSKPTSNAIALHGTAVLLADGERDTRRIGAVGQHAGPQHAGVHPPSLLAKRLERSSIGNPGDQADSR
jgi:hypothetical protein